MTRGKSGVPHNLDLFLLPLEQPVQDHQSQPKNPTRQITNHRSPTPQSPDRSFTNGTPPEKSEMRPCAAMYVGVRAEG